MISSRSGSASRWGGSPAGFSLVETALALLVASVGLTAVMGLFPTAMDQGKRAADSANAAFLADAAFASYRAYSEWTDPATGERGWKTLRTYEAIPPVSLTGGADVFWKDSPDMAFVADGTERTIRFVASGSAAGKWGAFSGSMPDIYDHGLKYRLTWVTIPNSRIEGLRMEIWPGEFADTSKTPMTFYTEFFDFGL